MKSKSASLQPDLFEQNDPGVPRLPGQMEQLAALLEAMLLEIAVALASREVGDEQDHG